VERKNCSPNTALRYMALYAFEYENLSFRFNETGEDFKFPACIHIDGVMATRRERQ